MAKLTGGIPVERAIVNIKFLRFFKDVAFKGTGKIEKVSENTLIGIDTKFIQEIKL